uniref:Uncharacterized protein n=1 Tax=Strigamia maritima TaxID=126957 RepID=T1JCI6_STRMM
MHNKVDNKSIMQEDSRAAKTYPSRETVKGFCLGKCKFTLNFQEGCTLMTNSREFPLRFYSNIKQTLGNSI